ncbi:MAG: lipoyl(octanoyl) transferase LipB [Anaerolineae bacterium]
MVTTLPTTTLDVIQAGVVPYAEAEQLQERLWSARCHNEIPDTLLVLQHPPVITLGQSGGLEDVHVSIKQLTARGVELHSTNRGGRATFHGPGQLVVYPIVKLPDRDLHTYLWKLEEAIIGTVSAWGVAADRDERYPGVWVNRNKLAAVGIAVRDDVTTHGAALNVNVDLSYFDLITPCGIADRGVTSMCKLLGHSVSMREIEDEFIQQFCNR